MASGCSSTAVPDPSTDADAGTGGEGQPPAAAQPGPQPTPDASSSATDAGGDVDLPGVGCPKTSCETYAARADACQPGKGLSTWKDICTNAAQKCIGATIPDCFCAAATACDDLRYCFLSPCEQ